jgi:hypothetical protein
MTTRNLSKPLGAKASKQYSSSTMQPEASHPWILGSRQENEEWYAFFLMPVSGVFRIVG